MQPVCLPLRICGLLSPTVLSTWPSFPAGTVQTMGKLLKAPDKRMAAVVTLRRLVTRCQ